MKIAASKNRLSINRMRRARIEVSDSSLAGRTAQSRAKLIEKLINKRHLIQNPYLRKKVSFTSLIVIKRKKAAKKLMLARKLKTSKLPKVSKPLSNALKWSAGWKAKPKGHFLKEVERKEEERLQK